MSHQIHLIGHVARVVESTTAGGDTIISFSAASNDVRSKDKKTTWFRCIGFGKIADTIRSLVKKGSLVYVRGELMSDPQTGCPKIYQSSSGVLRANNEVRIAYMEVVRRGSETTSTV